VPKANWTEAGLTIRGGGKISKRKTERGAPLFLKVSWLGGRGGTSGASLNARECVNLGAEREVPLLQVTKK